jgi:hypothetical protein
MSLTSSLLLRAVSQMGAVLLQLSRWAPRSHNGQSLLSDTGGTYSSQRKDQGGGRLERRDNTNQRVRYRKAKSVAGRIRWAPPKEQIHRKMAWPGRQAKALRANELAKIEAASRVSDYDVANVTVGESIGTIHDLPARRRRRAPRR